MPLPAARVKLVISIVEPETAEPDHSSTPAFICRLVKFWPESGVQERNILSMIRSAIPVF